MVRWEGKKKKGQCLTAVLNQGPGLELQRVLSIP